MVIVLSPLASLRMVRGGRAAASPQELGSSGGVQRWQAESRPDLGRDQMDRVGGGLARQGLALRRRRGPGSPCQRYRRGAKQSLTGRRVETRRVDRDAVPVEAQ